MRKKKVYRRSGFEDRIETNLKERGIQYEYESIKLHYTKETCPHCNKVVKRGTYTPDFIIQRSSGIRLVVEGKGRFTSVERTKYSRVKRDNPNEDIRLLFQGNNPIRKGSDTRYIDWALKNGFPCAVGIEIPDDWINEDAAQTKRSLNEANAITNKRKTKNATKTKT